MPSAECGHLDDGQLFRIGPTIGVDLGISLSPDELMHTNSTPYRALIDTGAKRTSVDRDLATKLGFAIKDSEEIGTVAGPDVVPVYDVAEIHIPSLGLHVPLYFLGVRLQKNLDCQVLIGRDILANYHMTYDGRTGRVTLSDEAPHHAATKRVGVGLLEKVKEFGRFFGS